MINYSGTNKVACHEEHKRRTQMPNIKVLPNTSFTLYWFLLFLRLTFSNKGLGQGHLMTLVRTVFFFITMNPHFKIRKNAVLASSA